MRDWSGQRKDAPSFYGFALKGDKITALFSKQSYVYQTHVDFAKEYPDMDKDDPNLKDMREVAGYEEEIYDLNGADALRTELRYGSGKGELKGYRYIIDTKNLGGGYIEVSVIPTSESEKIEDLIDADDVKMIVDSMKFVKLK